MANKLGQADAADGWLQRAIKEKVAPNKICPKAALGNVRQVRNDEGVVIP